MKKLLKRLCMLSGIFIIIGAVVFGIGFLGSDLKFKNLSHLTTKAYAYTESAQTAGTEINKVTIAYESNANVRVQFSDTADVISASYGSVVTKNGKSAGTVTLTDANGHLQIKETRSWKEKFRTLAWSSAFAEVNVEVTLPADRTYELAIYTNTGDVSFDGTACHLTSLTIVGDTTDIYAQNTDIVCSGNAKLETDTGDIKIGALTAKNVSIETDTGDVELKGDLFAETLQIECDTGDCEIFGNLTAKNVRIETDTGDVVMKNNSILDAEIILIETDTGDVNIKLAGTLLDYTITVDVDTGKCNVSNLNAGARKLNISVDTGDVDVYFAN